MSERLGYRPELDGLRALAVGAVMGFHLYVSRWFMRGGHIGVDVFFVLSGFLITSLLATDYDSRETGLRGFYWRRVARLAPALVLVVAVTVPVVLWLQPEGRNSANDTAAGGVVGLLYLMAWWVAFTGRSFGRLGHLWSLSVEEWFYGLWPLVLRRLWRPDRRAVARIVGVLIVVLVGYRAAAVARGWSIEHLYRGPDFRAEQLLIGCGLALVALRRRRWDGVVVAAALGFLAVMAVVGPADDTRLYVGPVSTLVAAASAVVIRHLMLYAGGLLGRLLASPALVWIGRRSYGLYLWHYPIFGLVFGLLELPRSALIVMSLIATFVVAAASFRFVEAPVGASIRRRSGAARLRVGVSQGCR